MRIGLKLVAALLFVVVTPRAVMGEVFEVVGADPAVLQVGSASLAEPDSASETDMAEGQGPTKPRWAIPRRRQLGQLPGSGLSTALVDPEQQQEASTVLVPTGTAGSDPAPNRH